jgi:hypothetical protein
MQMRENFSWRFYFDHDVNSGHADISNKASEVLWSLLINYIKKYNQALTLCTVSKELERTFQWKYCDHLCSF